MHLGLTTVGLGIPPRSPSQARLGRPPEPALPPRPRKGCRARAGCGQGRAHRAGTGTEGAGRDAHINPPCSSLAPLVKGLLGVGGKGMGRGDWGPSTSPHATPPQVTEPQDWGGPSSTRCKQGPQPCHFPPKGSQPWKGEEKRNRAGRASRETPGRGGRKASPTQPLGRWGREQRREGQMGLPREAWLQTAPSPRPLALEAELSPVLCWAGCHGDTAQSLAVGPLSAGSSTSPPGPARPCQAPPTQQEDSKKRPTQIFGPLNAQGRVQARVPASELSPTAQPAE